MVNFLIYISRYYTCFIIYWNSFINRIFCKEIINYYKLFQYGNNHFEYDYSGLRIKKITSNEEMEYV